MLSYTGFMKQTGGNQMSYIKQVTVSITEARELEKQGFILKFVMMHLDGTDTYEVFVK